MITSSETAGFEFVDPITVEVVRGHLTSTLQSMVSRIIRSALSPNITERRDVSSAVLDSKGNTIVQFEVAPVHLAELIAAGKYLLQNYPVEDIHPDDVFIANDCYTGGGTHLPDITIASPVFSEGRFVAIVGSLAHHVDVGGRPGSAPGGPAEIYEEGIRIPVTRIVEAGRLREDLLRLILLNCRMADQRRGDLLAQIAATRLGAIDIHQLCGRYGTDRVVASFDEFQSYAIRKLRARIAELPDGRYEYVDYMDDDGAGTEMIPVQVAIEVSGEDLHVDFTGTGPQTEGNINLVWPGTAGCVLYALRAALDPSIPPTSAFLDAVRMTMPEGSLINPRPPGGCDARIDTCQRVVGVLLGALAQALPNRLPAPSCDALIACNISGPHPETGDYYHIVEAYCGGSGGRPTKDGLSAVQVAMANIANFPIEVCESEYPVRYLSHRLRRDSGGVGEHRGGLGEIREVEMLAPRGWLGMHGDRHTTPARGVYGGGSGVPLAVWMNPDTERATRVPTKISRYPIVEGDVLSIRTASGGGYGDPLKRASDEVLADVVSDRVSVEAAERDYGVVIESGGGNTMLTVDAEATAAVRDRLAKRPS
jgi:N-methylhydantoinase B